MVQLRLWVAALSHLLSCRALVRYQSIILMLRLWSLSIDIPRLVNLSIVKISTTCHFRKSIFNLPLFLIRWRNQVLARNKHVRSRWLLLLPFASSDQSSVVSKDFQVWSSALRSPSLCSPALWISFILLVPSIYNIFFRFSISSFFELIEFLQSCCGAALIVLIALMHQWCLSFWAAFLRSRPAIPNRSLYYRDILFLLSYSLINHAWDYRIKVSTFTTGLLRFLILVVVWRLTLVTMAPPIFIILPFVILLRCV